MGKTLAAKRLTPRIDSDMNVQPTPVPRLSTPHAHVRIVGKAGEAAPLLLPFSLDTPDMPRHLRTRAIV
jgi:hypothetical protein